MKPDLAFRFAVVSDLHIGLPHTIYDHPSRFHLVEWSIPAFESVCAHLKSLDLDFILIPGDLTQHGEPDNHRWVSQFLESLPFPAYVIPGNHDTPVAEADGTSIAPQKFAEFYRPFGYEQASDFQDYCQSLLPGVTLIG
ncbi:MAG: metallophosphoesterase, partial [Cyanobacteria bacterium P01_F01_bin.42]